MTDDHKKVGRKWRRAMRTGGRLIRKTQGAVRREGKIGRRDRGVEARAEEWPAATGGQEEANSQCYKEWPSSDRITGQGAGY
jgi:hypothetical protein